MKEELSAQENAEKLDDNARKFIVGELSSHFLEQHDAVSYRLTQDVSFIMKYDEFEGGKSAMLEVDAATEDERKLFDPSTFPYALSEVTGDINYYGYRMASDTVH